MRILVLPGDGIGPEITAATLAVPDAIDTRRDLGLSFGQRDIGHKALKKKGSCQPDGVRPRCCGNVKTLWIGPARAAGAAFPATNEGAPE